MEQETNEYTKTSEKPSATPRKYFSISTLINAIVLLALFSTIVILHETVDKKTQNDTNVFSQENTPIETSKRKEQTRAPRKSSISRASPLVHANAKDSSPLPQQVKNETHHKDTPSIVVTQDPSPSLELDDEAARLSYLEQSHTLPPFVPFERRPRLGNVAVKEKGRK